MLHIGDYVHHVASDPLLEGKTWYRQCSASLAKHVTQPKGHRSRSERKIKSMIHAKKRNKSLEHNCIPVHTYLFHLKTESWPH
uniref:Uncharacterized protein n=1 Tax=Arundo donax TaxID=35708 RepID=A0A0A9A9Q6_ARUDO